MSRTARVLVMLAAVAVVVAMPGTAQAKPVEQGHYSGEASFSDVICGLAVTIDTTFQGVVVIRPVKGSDGQAFFAHDNYEFTDVITNPANGNQVIAHGNGVFHEQSARQIEGNIWEFTAQDAGTFTLSDSHGNSLLRDRGVVKLRAIFDTLGDGQPGGVLIEDELTAVHGPHADDSAFCETFLGELT